MVASKRELEILQEYSRLNQTKLYYRPCKSDKDTSCPENLLDNEKLTVDAIYPDINVALEIVSMPYNNYNRFKRICNSNSLEMINKNSNLVESLTSEYGKHISKKIQGSL